MPPQQKKPKAKDDKARKQQAHDLVQAAAKERLPDLKDEDVQVWSTAPSRGDGDWRAVVVIDGPTPEVHYVGYNNELDQLYVDRLGRAM